MVTGEDVADSSVGKLWLAASVTSCFVAIGMIAYGYAFSFGRLRLDGWRITICIFVLLVTSVGSLATTNVIPWRSRRPADWLRAKTLGTAIYALMVGMLSATAMIQLVDPDEPPEELTQTRTHALRAASNSDRILRGLTDANLISGPGTSMDAHLPGVWGERGCRVTYSVSVDRDVVVMKSLESELGMAPFTQTLRLAPARPNGGNGMTAMAEILDGPEAGSSVAIGYERFGKVERLVRDQKTPQRVTYLDRCAR